VKKFIVFLSLVSCLLSLNAASVTVVAVVNGNPITDVDITERTKIMPASLNNRGVAKNAIIDDFIKIEYAKSLRIEPSEKEVAAEMTMDEGMKEHANNPQAKLAARANAAWRLVIRGTIPTISVTEADIAAEMADLERERGLPLDMTFLRLIKVPKDVYAKLEKPQSCAEGEGMAKKLGGAPQRVNALEYELAPEIREHFIGLPNFTWSPLKGGQTFLICDKKKTDEWGQLDEMVKQNAVYKRAMFQMDQLLRQLRRRATITDN
jgi:hypothetical protein